MLKTSGAAMSPAYSILLGVYVVFTVHWQVRPKEVSCPLAPGFLIYFYGSRIALNKLSASNSNFLC